MIKGKYLIVGHMWWYSPVLGKRTREAEVVGSNSGNTGKNRTRAYSRKKSRDLRRERGGKNKIFFLNFIPTANIYFSTQKNNACHLCVDIGDVLRIP